MPELPEVETVARDLQRVVAGATIRDATVSWDRTIRHPQPPERFVAEVAGRDDPTRGPASEDGPPPPRGRARDDGRAPDDRRAARRARGNASGPVRPRRVRARRRPRAAVPRCAEVRADRAVARGRAADRRRRTWRAVEARRGGEPPISDRRGVQRPWSRAAQSWLHGRAAEGTTRTAEREAEDAAPRPVLHRRRGKHLRRRGAVAGAAAPAARGGHARRCRSAAAASVHPQGPAAGDREPRQQLQRLRERRWRARRERGAADGLPAHRPALLPMRAADPAHRRRPAQHPLLPPLPGRSR